MGKFEVIANHTNLDVKQGKYVANLHEGWQNIKAGNATILGYIFLNNYKTQLMK